MSMKNITVCSKYHKSPCTQVASSISVPNPKVVLAMSAMPTSQPTSRTLQTTATPQKTVDDVTVTIMMHGSADLSSLPLRKEPTASSSFLQLQLEPAEADADATPAAGLNSERYHLE